MATTPNPNSETTSRILDRVAAGDAAGWEALLRRFHDRLRRMIAVRLDPRLQGRFDPSDVLQETYLDALGRLPEYLCEPKLPFFLWIRYMTGHHLGRIHRDHLARQMRDAGREVSLYQGAMPEASSAALAAQLLGKESRPSELAMAALREIIEAGFDDHAVHFAGDPDLAALRSRPDFIRLIVDPAFPADPFAPPP